jgi:cytochrome bd-type quinol oxidase subunit 2
VTINLSQNITAGFNNGTQFWKAFSGETKEREFVCVREIGRVWDIYIYG